VETRLSEDLQGGVENGLALGEALGIVAGRSARSASAATGRFRAALFGTHTPTIRDLCVSRLWLVDLPTTRAGRWNRQRSVR
jgi:hypothetical protein